MSFPTGTAIVIPGVTGNTSYAPIDMDAVDKAAIITPGLIAFSRAKKFANTAKANASYKDRTGNVVTVAGTAKTYVEAMAAMNGKPAVTMDGANGAGPYKLGGMVLPASFTFVTVVNVGALKDGNNLLKDTANQFQFNSTAKGQLSIDSDGGGSGDTSHSTAAGTLAAGASYLVGCSHDAATKTSRIFVGSAAALGTWVSAVAHAAGGVPLPFGSSEGANNFNFNGSWGMWALFDRPFGGGASASDEVLFAAFIAAVKAHWSV